MVENLDAMKLDRRTKQVKDWGQGPDQQHKEGNYSEEIGNKKELKEYSIVGSYERNYLWEWERAYLWERATAMTWACQWIALEIHTAAFCYWNPMVDS